MAHGHPAWFADVEYSVQAGIFRTIIANVLSKGTLFTIGCTDMKEHFEEALPEFKALINSFSF